MTTTPPSQETQDSTIAPTTAKDPLLSILNVVVDHVMMPPSPLEPREFREVCRWSQEEQEVNEDSACKESNGGRLLLELSSPSMKGGEDADHDEPPQQPSSALPSSLWKSRLIS